VPGIDIIDIYYGEPNINLYGNPVFGVESVIPNIDVASLVCDADTLNTQIPVFTDLN
jgi:hypothetical protein